MTIDKSCRLLYILLVIFLHTKQSGKICTVKRIGEEKMKKQTGENTVSDRLKHALTSLSKASGLNLCMLDLMGNILIYPTNDCALCKFVRSDDKGRALCIRFAAHAVLDAAHNKKTFFYKCPFGLIDFAVPVFDGGEFVGAICGGQVRSEDSARHLDFVYPPISQQDAGGKYATVSELYSLMPEIPAEKMLETARLVELLTERVGDEAFQTMREFADDGDAFARNKLQPAFDYIQLNFTRQISAKHMAEICFVSENYFSRLFGKLTGTTLPKFVTGLRMAKAKELLLSPNAKINAVAYEVGYDDPAYFIRRFKLPTGMTPAAWQKENVGFPLKPHSPVRTARD